MFPKHIYTKLTSLPKRKTSLFNIQNVSVTCLVSNPISECYHLLLMKPNWSYEKDLFNHRSIFSISFFFN